MTDFLVSKIIGKKGDIRNAALRQRCGMASGAVGLICNFILFVMKLVIGLLSGSVAVAADAFNNLTDGISSLISIAGFKISGKEPDKDHPFGYGRTEYIAGFVVTIIILVVGFEFLKTSVERMISPEQIAFSMVMLVLLVVSILIKMWMSRFYVKMGEKIGSPVLIATGKDSRNDVITTFVVILGMITGMVTPYPVDGYVGLIVALFILWSGIHCIGDALSPLLGAPANQELTGQIEKIVCAFPYIIGVHDLIIHDYGVSRILATLHAEVPAGEDVIAVHEEIDRAEKKVLADLGVYLVIHMDPVETDNAFRDMLHGKVKDCLNKIDTDFSMHDFRVVKENDMINLYFDVMIPYRYREKEKSALAETIEEKMKEIDTRYHTVITFDYEM